MLASSSAARTARGESATSATARTARRRTMHASSQTFTARSWLAARPAGRAGWLGGRLLRQDQLVGPRNAEPVLFVTVDDDELARVPEELGAAHDPSSGTLRRTRGLLPRARRRRGHRALADRAPAARAPVARRPPKKSALATTRYRA